MRLRAFYEAVFEGEAEGDELYSGLALNGLAFTFDSAVMLANNPSFCYTSDTSSGNVIIGFDVDDADAEYERLPALGAETLNRPTTHPRGARSFQFRDIDGNILNFRSFPE